MLPAAGADRGHRQPDVLVAGLHVAQHVAHGVGAVGLDDVHRVDAVALGLAHPLAIAVEDVGVDEDVGEGDVAQVVLARQDHPRHPERDDVAGGDQAGAGVVVVEAAVDVGADGAQGRLARLDGRRGGVGPAQGGVGPQGRGEPGVEHIDVTLVAQPLQQRQPLIVVGQQADVDAAGGVGWQRERRRGRSVLHQRALSSDGHLLEPHQRGLTHYRRQLGQVELAEGELPGPDRDAVAPPELPADGPVALLTQPVEVGLGVALGMHRDAAVEHGVHGRLHQAGAGVLLGRAAAHGHAALHVAHADIPLVREVGLHRGLAPIAVADLHLAILHGGQQPLALEVGHHPLAGLEAVEPGVGAGRVVERAVGLKDVDDRDLLAVAGPDVVVVGVVGRRDLDAA